MAPNGRILVVCTGNVCRSPYLHLRLADALRRAGSDIKVESAGTGALAGYGMDPRMAAHLDGLGWEHFMARDITPELVAEADLILTATRDHRSLVTRLVPRALRKTFVAADFAHLARGVADEDLAAAATLKERVDAVSVMRTSTTPLGAEVADVVDPFRREDDVYAQAAQQIDELVNDIVRVLV